MRETSSGATAFDNRSPGSHASRSIAPVSSRSSSRTAPRPSQRRNASGSRSASSCGIGTLSTTDAPRRDAAAVYDTPDISYGRPTRMSHCDSSRSIVRGSASSHARPSSANCSIVRRSLSVIVTSAKDPSLSVDGYRPAISRERRRARADARTNRSSVGALRGSEERCHDDEYVSSPCTSAPVPPLEPPGTRRSRRCG